MTFEEELRDSARKTRDIPQARRHVKGMLALRYSAEQIKTVLAAMHPYLDEAEVQGLLEEKPAGEEVRVPWDPSKVRPFWETALEGDTADYDVAGVIMNRGITIIVADSGVGKTNCNASIMYALIKGQTWAGRATTPRPVWVMDKESSQADLRNAIKLLGINAQDIGMFSQPFLWCTGDQAREPDDADMIAAVEACESGRGPIIVFDSLVRYFDGDENDSKVSNAFFKKCKSLCDKGATVVVLHHTGKNSLYRGSSDIKAAASIMWGLTSNNLNKLDILTFKALKFRGQGEDFSVKFNYKTRTFDAVVNPGNSVANERAAGLGDLLKQHGGKSLTSFEKLAVDGKVATREQARAYIDDGLQGGWVEDRGTAGDTRRRELWFKEPTPERASVNAIAARQAEYALKVKAAEWEASAPGDDNPPLQE